ncbi:MAG: hypothetical protein AAFR65_15185 [Pseudomonadota bacterium]
MGAKIPVFVSRPSELADDQQATYNELVDILTSENLELRRLGDSDYPSDYPLKEVAIISQKCSGAVILGFAQTIVRAESGRITLGRVAPSTKRPDKKKSFHFATPWNNLEAGILFGLKLPLLVFREDGIKGGVFDDGVTDVFLQKLPRGGFGDKLESVVYSVQNWVSKVRYHYRKWD